MSSVPVRAIHKSLFLALAFAAIACSPGTGVAVPQPEEQQYTEESDEAATAEAWAQLLNSLGSLLLGDEQLDSQPPLDTEELISIRERPRLVEA